MEVPECPEEAVYLVDYASELFGRSGASMAGLLPVSHQEMVAWAQAMDVRLEPWEFAAIRMLDAARLYPDDQAEEAEGVEPEARKVHQPDVPVWKQRPEGVEPQFVNPIQV